MPDYVATNVSARSTVGETSDRSVLTIDGSRLHPERTYSFDEFTSDILEEMVNGNLRVETEAGVPVTIESLERDGYDLKTKTVTERTRNVDGRVDRSYKKYYLEETQTTEGGESDGDAVEQPGPEDVEAEDASEEETGGEDADNEDSGEEPSEETEETKVSEEPEESEPADKPNEDAEPSPDPAESSVLQELKESGVIPEDAESSSDVNAAPMAKIIRKAGDRIPDSFFEGESRKTVNAALEDLE